MTPSRLAILSCLSANDDENPSPRAAAFQLPT